MTAETQVIGASPAFNIEYLELALAIYRRIGVPAAQHVWATINHHGLASTTVEPSASGAQQRRQSAAHAVAPDEGG